MPDRNGKIFYTSITSLSHISKSKGVVIAFDSRNHSREFAYECTRVLCANGIKTYLFDDLRPTPELSFAIRFLNCSRGIVITASHNPKEYNGYKVYGDDGAQIPPSIANSIIKYINTIDVFNDVKICDIPNYINIGKDIDDAYISAVKAESMKIKISPDFKAVYTPFHGAGNKLVRRILSEIGVRNVFTVPEQEQPDGNFPTVKSPNPEDRDAFNIAIKYAKEQNADLVLGTDPDSDRVGIAVNIGNGKFYTFNGNQTGIMLCEFILRKMHERGELSDKHAIIKTIVTTDEVKAVANAYGIKVVDVLTGFKFIGEKIKEFEQNSESKFLFGLEESYGYLKGTYARDKDAVVSSMLICEMAADYKLHGMTLYDGLLALYEKYGFYLERLTTKTLESEGGQKQIDEIMRKFRVCELPLEVAEVKDYSTGINGLPKSNVLKFILKNGWFAVRPSGTEPKIKFYFGTVAESIKTAEKALDYLENIVLDVIN